MYLLSTINHYMFWALAALLLVDAYFVILHRGVPNIRTAPAIRKKIIALIKDDFQKKFGAGHKGKVYTIVDLGSGNGLFTREIAQALPEARVIGVEIAAQSVAWSNFWKKCLRLHNLDYQKKNFFDFDFASADAVVTYLIPEVLGGLGKKIYDGAQPGTLVISNKFPLGGDWQAPEILQVKTLYLHQGKVNIYRK